MFYTFRTSNRKCGLFRTFGQSSSSWLSKLHPRVQKNLFQFISFFSKKKLILNLCWFWAQVFHILRQTIFSRLVKTAILGAKRTFWGETVFWLDFFKVVLSFSKSFRTFGQAFWQVCQNWILKSTGMFLGKLCISWRNLIFLNLEFCPEIFRTSGKSFLQGFKAAFYVSWENCSGKIFNSQKKKWKQFRFFSKICGFAAAKVEHFGENRIPRVQKNVSKRNTIFIWKFSNCFIVFTIRTKPYIAFGLSANSIGKVVKTAFQLSRWSYGEQDFSQKNVLLIIWLFHRRISNFRWIMYGNFVKTSFYVSRGSYLGEILWKKKFHKQFRIFINNYSDKIEQACENCIPHIHMKFLRRNVFLFESFRNYLSFSDFERKVLNFSDL